MNIMTWNEVIMYVIETVFKIFIMVLIPYAANLLRVKLKNDMQIKYLGRFEKLVVDAVFQVQQTYVENMKAENLFDEDAQIKAFDMVKKTVLSTVNEEMMQIVVDAVGDFDEYLRNLIEAQVFSIKQNSSLLLGGIEEFNPGEIDKREADAE